MIGLIAYSVWQEQRRRIISHRLGAVSHLVVDFPVLLRYVAISVEAGKEKNEVLDSALLR